VFHVSPCEGGNELEARGRTIHSLLYEYPYAIAMKLFPSTKFCPCTDPTVAHTWFVRLTFSYPGPCGTNDAHEPLSVWNSFATTASKP
jgi:hypothetical protein